MPFRDILEKYIRLENDGRERDRRFQEKSGNFLLDLKAMLDILSNSLRNEPEINNSALGQKLESTIQIVRTAINDLELREKPE
jgi:hypothetical protein